MTIATLPAPRWDPAINAIRMGVRRLSDQSAEWLLSVWQDEIDGALRHGDWPGERIAQRTHLHLALAAKRAWNSLAKEA